MAEVAVILGSKSDLKFWEESEKYLTYFGLTADLYILSAHRTPREVSEFATGARQKGYKILVAGAGMAAHLAGVLAAQTDLPVLGVPLPGGIMDGLDALLSTVQMPAGIPVATFAVGNAGFRNACVFAARILSLENEQVAARLKSFKEQGSKL
jgi:phosphoribosylaminoimidazole carboxylase PurE protein